MLARPSAYLTLEKPVRKPWRTSAAEAAAGVASWWDRLADRMMSDGLAWRVLLVVLWLITILCAYNVGLNAG
ncbi:MAG: hypothetical protein ACM3ZA_10240 [Bacillota bacterium]